MTYGIAVAVVQAADADCRAAGAALAKFPTGAMGLTPDHVKRSPEFQAAKLAFDRAFNRLRDANGYIRKAYPKELRADRARQLDARKESRPLHRHGLRTDCLT